MQNRVSGASAWQWGRSSRRSVFAPTAKRDSGALRYWMTMRGGWRRLSPSRAATLSHTRAAMA